MNPKDLGKAMKKLRAERPQKVVAARANISPSNWSLYENGKRPPNLRTFARIAQGLGVTVEVLEEECQRARKERLLSEQAFARMTEATSEPDKDPMLRALDEHLQGLAYHLRMALLTVGYAPKPPRTDGR
ncbi:MAG TPA: helix-turn-helix transcriptional regulator [Thermoanaerobaculia bacterium]